eukprot:763012-Hanusia_phi.AAC.3
MRPGRGRRKEGGRGNERRREEKGREEERRSEEEERRGEERRGGRGVRTSASSHSKQRRHLPLHLQQAATLRTLIVLDGGIHVYMSDTNELLCLASGTKKRRQDVVLLQKLLDEDLKVVVQPTTSKRRERTPVQLKLLGCSPQRELVLSVPSSAVQGDKAGVVPPHLKSSVREGDWGHWEEEIREMSEGEEEG